MILGIGVDIVRVARFQEFMDRNSPIFDRIFTPGERDSVGQGPEAAARWAARFSAKEALIKAAGGLHGSRWKDIEVKRVPGRAAEVCVAGLLGQWIARHNATIWLSFSHEKSSAVAMVVLEATHDGQY